MANPAHIKSLLHQRDREKRKRLILLVRILTKLLDRTNRIVLLHKVKCVIREYSNRCHQGDLSVSLVHDCLEQRLQILVDDATWTQAILCLELYMAHRHSQKQAPGSRMKFARAPSDSKIPAKGGDTGTGVQV